MPKISVIVPVYNVEKYLSQCLDSILNQTFVDFECICVNDGSTDNSLSILQDYANKDGRIKVISQEKKGVSVARNIALKQCVGEYVTFVDADDFLSKDCFEKLLVAIEKENCDAVWCSHVLYYQSENRYETGKNKKEIQELLRKYSNSKSVYKKKKIALELTEKSRNIWGKIYKRDVVEKNKVCFLENSFAGVDHPFTVLMMLCLPKIILIDDELYFYRKQIESITSNKNTFRINAINSFICLTKELEKRNFLKQNNILKRFVLSHFVSNLGKRNTDLGQQEIFPIALNHFLYLKEILKDSWFKLIKINLYVFIMKVFKTKSFVFFRILKNF